MSARYRIALQVGMFDPYWVQVREAVLRHAPQYGVDLVSLNIDAVSDLADDEADSIFAELVVQHVQALIANTIALNLLDRVNAHGIPSSTPPKARTNDRCFRHDAGSTMQLLVSANGFMRAFHARRMC
jgi:hypothetical protein